MRTAQLVSVARNPSTLPIQLPPPPPFLREHSNQHLPTTHRIIPAEIFDTHTRSKGVSIATMVSFAFNTMIGQVTDIAIQNIGGWRYFIVFTVCNFTNAVFFWLVLPETKQIPLEEMNYLFTHAPWIVVGADKSKYREGLGQDLERRVAEVREKGVHEEEYHE